MRSVGATTPLSKNPPSAPETAISAARAAAERFVVADAEPSSSSFRAPDEKNAGSANGPCLSSHCLHWLNDA